MRPEAFQQLFCEQIPLLARMQIYPESVSDDQVVVRIPLEGNSNDKGTLFAGAAYSALVIAGWMLVMNCAEQSGFRRPWAAIVDAHCHYAKAIREEVCATAVFVETPILIPGEKNWPKVIVSIGDCVVFEGTYAVGERHSA